MEKIQEKAEEYSINNAKFVADNQSRIMLQKAFEAGANEVIQHPQEYIDCCASNEDVEKLADEAGYPRSDKTTFETTYWTLHNIWVEGSGAAHPAPDCCVWVKASERLPDEIDKKYVLRWTDTQHPFISFLKRGTASKELYFTEVVNHHLDLIEWLYEPNK